MNADPSPGDRRGTSSFWYGILGLSLGLLCFNDTRRDLTIGIGMAAFTVGFFAVANGLMDPNKWRAWHCWKYGSVVTLVSCSVSYWCQHASVEGRFDYCPDLLKASFSPSPA